jgi:iron complex outermembrane receptor protein
MTFFTPRCALAAAVAVCFAAPAFAQSTVVISGSRFASDPSLLPIGATTITAADIRRAGVSDVNQAIRKIGGVYGRQSLTGSPDFGLDLRGFGTNSDQNVVIVLDGVRLNENELSSATLSTIPIDLVERIDIMRGGASVLYGEGATGGVIQIVTKRAQAGVRSGNVFTELGRFSSGEARASVAQGFDGFAIDASAGHQRTDNYRDNNDFKQSRFNGGLQFDGAFGRLSLRADIARQDQRFAGSLTEAQFKADPRQSKTPDDFGAMDSDRYTAAWEHKVGAFDLAAELSHRKKEAEATYVSAFGVSRSAYDTRQTQFSPRVRHLGQFGGLLNEVVAGFDFGRWNRVTSSDFSAADATQRSKAFYLRDEMKFAGAQQFRLAAGVRRELFDKDSVDPAPFTSATYSVKQAHNAWEVQGSMLAAPGLTAWAKAGQSYRVANADENGFTPQANQPLKTQTSHDAEIGLGYAQGAAKADARIFRHNLDNEIYYDRRHVRRQHQPRPDPAQGLRAGRQLPPGAGLAGVGPFPAGRSRVPLRPQCRARTGPGAETHRHRAPGLAAVRRPECRPRRAARRRAALRQRFRQQLQHPHAGLHRGRWPLCAQVRPVGAGPDGAQPVRQAVLQPSLQLPLWDLPGQWPPTESFGPLRLLRPPGA